MKIIAYYCVALMLMLSGGKSLASAGAVKQPSCHEMPQNTVQQNEMQCCDDMQQCNTCAHCVNISVLSDIIISHETEQKPLKIAAISQDSPIILNLKIERPPCANKLT